ncbi:MAG: homoserine kinase [Sporolactobacillus sp.]
MSGSDHALSIRVPGSTSNLGPGFDSIGMAIDRYLDLKAVPGERWSFRYLDSPDFNPPVSENLIYQTAAAVAKRAGCTLPAQAVQVRSDIPLARGLGSSGAAIIAGIELADALLSLRLSSQAKATVAGAIEGHPDNVTASLFGGLVVSVQAGEGVDSVCLPAPAFDFVTVIPDFELKTSDARRVLPASLPFSEAIAGSSVANVLIGALINHDGALAGRMMESDHFHQSFRAGLLPHFNETARVAKRNGAYGTFLSGAGPTLMALASQTASGAICDALRRTFPSFECTVLHPVAGGAVRTDTVPES